MIFNNFQIYQMADSLIGLFDNKDIYIPVKANFIMQKNIQVIVAAAREIDKARLDVLKHYGKHNEGSNSYTIPADLISEAEEEFNNLFNIEQDLPIKTLDIEAFGNVEFSPAQMNAIMFMIEEEG